METLQINIINKKIQIINRDVKYVDFNKKFRKKYNKFINNKSDKTVVIDDNDKFISEIIKYINTIKPSFFPKHIIFGGEPLSLMSTVYGLLHMINQYSIRNNIHDITVTINVSGIIGYSNLQKQSNELLQRINKEFTSISVDFLFIIDNITNGKNGLDSFINYMMSNNMQEYKDPVLIIKNIKNKKIRVLIDDIESKFEYNILALHSIFECPIEVVFDYDALRNFSTENYLTLQRVALLFYKWKIYRDIDFIQFTDEPYNCLDHQLINGKRDLYIARHGNDYCKDNDIKFGNCYIQSKIMDINTYQNITKILNVYKKFDSIEKPIHDLIKRNKIIKTKRIEDKNDDVKVIKTKKLEI